MTIKQLIAELDKSLREATISNKKVVSYGNVHVSREPRGYKISVPGSKSMSQAARNRYFHAGRAALGKPMIKYWDHQTGDQYFYVQNRYDAAVFGFTVHNSIVLGN